MECAEDHAKQLRDAQFRGATTASHGRSVLPIETVIAGLASQPCRCPRHRQSTFAPVAPTVAAPSACARSRNPIWGEDEPLLLSEAAVHAGMPLGTFRQKIYAREIASVRVGKQRKVQPSAVRAYLERNKRPAL